MEPRVWTVERKTAIGFFLSKWLVEMWTRYGESHVNVFTSVKAAKGYLRARYEEGGRYELENLKANHMLYLKVEDKRENVGDE